MKVFHIAVFCFACIMADGQSSVFIEGGPAFSFPLLRGSGSSYEDNSSGSNDKIKTGMGFYLKTGINIRVLKKNNFRFSLPVGVSYFYYSQNFLSESYGAAQGSNSAYDIHGKSTTKTRYAGCFFGPQFTFSKDKFSAYGNLLFNGLTVYTIRDYYTDSQGYSTVFTYNQTKGDRFLYITSSLGFGASYNINKFSLGLNTDVYFLNLLSRYSSFTSSHFTFTGIGNQIWINPGIRIQYNLK